MNCSQYLYLVALNTIRVFSKFLNINFKWKKILDGVKQTPYQKQRQKLKDRIEQEKDQDIKRELRKGNIVTIVEDSPIDY